MLRPLTEADFEPLHALASDPQVTRYTSFGPNTLEQTRAFLTSAVEQAAAEMGRNLAVESREDGVLIGCCGLGQPSHGQYEIGYVLDKPYWGRGLATELVEALAAFAFGSLGAKKLWAPVDARNAASCRVLEKVGFTLEGVLREDRLKWPEGRDTKLFGMLAREWFR